jgi:hypothetical protein
MEEGGQRSAAWAMRPTTQTLFDYWNDVRAGRLAPDRLEIEPSRIAAILSETFMLQRADPGNYRYRLAGTRLCELFGAELRGRNFLEFWRKEDGVMLRRCLSAVCEQGAVGVLTLECGDGPRRRMELEAILLPLLHGGKDLSRVLGAMTAVQAHGLSYPPLGPCRLVRHELVRLNGRPHPPVSLVETGQAPLLPEPLPKHASAVRRFRVLHGGRSARKDDGH